jgi:hypothetical protein
MKSLKHIQCFIQLNNQWEQKENVTRDDMKSIMKLAIRISFRNRITICSLSDGTKIKYII